MGLATPCGAYGEATQVSVSVPQISSATFGSAYASWYGCTPTTPQIQPDAGSSDATAMTVSANSRGCTSNPLYRLGCSSLIAPTDLRSLTVSSGRGSGA